MFLDSISEATPQEIAMASVISFYEDLSEDERRMISNEHKFRNRIEKLQYWLDNCGGDEDHSAEWYCNHCDQEECCKRVAPRIIGGMQVER